jgi:hypothetical protein
MFRDRCAARSVWEKFKGPFDQGLYVLHRCDNPLCVNPDHLFLGNQQANMDDMCAKGRQKKDGQPPGSDHAQAKLTEAQALEIIARRRAGERYSQIAADYPVRLEQVRRIAIGERWAHLQEAA